MGDKTTTLPVGSVVLDVIINEDVGGGVRGTARIAMADFVTLVLATVPGLIAADVASEIASSALVPADVGVSVEAYDADILKSDVAATLTKGFVDAEKDYGTLSTGSLKPAPADGNFAKLINGGAFTLQAPDASGSYSIVLDITNNASAGAITLTGFTKTEGDAFDTTNGHAWRCYISKGPAGTHIFKKAMF